MRRRAWMAGVALGAIALLLVGWLLAPRPREAPLEPTLTADPTPIPAQPPDAIPPAPEAPADAPPSPYLAAHAAVADALGYVAIRCQVGPEWDTDDLVGAYHQKIAGGWYTNVETALTGRHGVERRYPKPGEEGPLAVDFETLFDVSWTAAAPGEVVPCTIHPIERAELQVRLTDDAGKPMPGFQVYGCGGDDLTDADGLAVLDVRAGDACVVKAYRKAAPEEVAHGMCQAEALQAALVKDEVRRVDLRVTCATIGEIVAAREEAEPEPRAPTPERLPELPHAEELARFRALTHRDLGAEGNQLVRDLIAHRERVAALRAKHDAQLAEIAAIREEMDALAARAATADTPEAKQALREESAALVERLRAAMPAMP